MSQTPQSADEQARPNRCPGHQRHWFASYRMVGSSLPTCVRCGAPNPNYRPEDDPHIDTRTRPGKDS